MMRNCWGQLRRARISYSPSQLTVSKASVKCTKAADMFCFLHFSSICLSTNMMSAVPLLDLNHTKMVSTRSGKPFCAPPCVTQKFPKCCISSFNVARTDATARTRHFKEDRGERLLSTPLSSKRSTDRQRGDGEREEVGVAD